MKIAEKDGVTLRTATADDMPAIDHITVVCYTPIFESYVNMLGENCYQVVRHEPEKTWEERKTGQNHELFAEHPDWVWVLERDGDVFGYITFYLIPAQGYGHIDNNGVLPEKAGHGWGKFLYEQVLAYFRLQGLRYAHVDTGLDDAHIPARRAYEAVGFDRQIPNVEYWMDLGRKDVQKV